MSNIIKFQDILNMNQKNIINFIKKHNIKHDSYARHALLLNIMEYLSSNNTNTVYSGVVEIINNYGFLRNKKNNFLNTNLDIYISNYLIKKYNIQRGDKVSCTIKKRNEQKCFSAYDIIEVNGSQGFQDKHCYFKNLKAMYPEKQIILENDELKSSTARAIDLLCPLGAGQRGLIVAQPKAGKTTVLHHIAQAILKNHPNFKLIILLVGERPEEVDEMENILGLDSNVEIFFSTFDINGDQQIKTSEMCLKYAKRQVELGYDTIILMDSLTRLVRAYNTVVPSSGRVWSGGIEPEAIQRAKKFFGAARATRGGKSLTILCTCLTNTGSRMDEVIYEEFKGTGNYELILKRELSQKQIYPAICPFESGTRRFEKFVEKPVKIKQLYSFLSHQNSSDPGVAIKQLLNLVNAYPTNDQLLDQILKESIKFTKRAYNKHK